ncbi:uncharacterized protein LOC143203882 [Rhynchophorus ferrugineus]|uniref:uncharacterized protein LOC143203882 n=1 Tax=Rhynchophorus ferrugineus TaxID=354439 RepID=UPI003FCCA05B
MSSKEWSKKEDGAPVKAKTTRSAGKVLYTVFWDWRGLLRPDQGCVLQPVGAGYPGGEARSPSPNLYRTDTETGRTRLAASRSERRRRRRSSFAVGEYTGSQQFAAASSRVRSDRRSRINGPSHSVHRPTPLYRTDGPVITRSPPCVDVCVNPIPQVLDLHHRHHTSPVVTASCRRHGQTERATERERERVLRDSSPSDVYVGVNIVTGASETTSQISRIWRS